VAEPGLVAAYVRVSSASQGSALQRDAIERAATARGETISRWFSDVRTGATMQRSDLDEMRRNVREGYIRKVYVFRLDRLTRTGIRDTLELVEEMRRHGCDLVTIADGFDFGGPAAEIVLAVMAWAAKLERLAISERVSAAARRRKSLGLSWGRGRRMDPGDEDRARTMLAKGRTIRAISVALKVPRATVWRALHREPAERPSQKKGPKKGKKISAKRKGKRGASH
jgi:DNA invertase Pin-like site-specific DNA recombinase